MSENSTYSTNSDDSVERDDVDFFEEEEEGVEEEVEVHSSKLGSAKDDVESKMKVSKVSRFELSPSPSMSRADVDDEAEGEDDSDSDDEQEDATNKESAALKSDNEEPSEVE